MAKPGFLGFNATKTCSETRTVSLRCLHGRVVMAATHTSLV
jgi:hypothetical protein